MKATWLTDERIEWDAFEKYDEILMKYLPLMGQGDTMATQFSTAVNKLAYNWYNDGDVYDTRFRETCNDLSSYANWLAEYIAGASPILDQINYCFTSGAYEHILMALVELYAETVENHTAFEKKGDVYSCEGDYSCEEEEEEEEEEDWED